MPKVKIKSIVYYTNCSVACYPIDKQDIHINLNLIDYIIFCLCEFSNHNILYCRRTLYLLTNNFKSLRDILVYRII